MIPALRIVPAAGLLPAHVLALVPVVAPAPAPLRDCGGCEDCHARRRRAIERQARRVRAGTPARRP